MGRQERSHGEPFNGCNMLLHAICLMLQVKFIQKIPTSISRSILHRKKRKKMKFEFDYLIFQELHSYCTDALLKLEHCL